MIKLNNAQSQQMLEFIRTATQKLNDYWDAERQIEQICGEDTEFPTFTRRWNTLLPAASTGRRLLKRSPSK